MSRLKSCVMSVLLPLVFYLPGQRAEGQEITFCSLRLSKAVLESHATFSAIYDFDVDKNGSPRNVNPISKQFTDAADVRACVARWRLPQAASEHLVAVFEWRHGIGWTTESISGKEFELVIRFDGERCQYCSEAKR